ncbi:MAG: hypothetical protein DWI29_03845 [Planctomycetota bacterium]|nr:MAG: hypothetical protein DWI29_03845 [Planctomycetota bacterium]
MVGAHDSIFHPKSLRGSGQNIVHSVAAVDAATCNRQGWGHSQSSATAKFQISDRNFKFQISNQKSPGS